MRAPHSLVSSISIDSTTELSLRVLVVVMPPLLATSVCVLLSDAGDRVSTASLGLLSGIDRLSGFDIAIVSAILPGGRSGFVLLPLDGLLTPAAERASHTHIATTTQAGPKQFLEAPGVPASGLAAGGIVGLRPTGVFDTGSQPPETVAGFQTTVVTSVRELLRTLDQLRRSLRNQTQP
ncbi:MAG: hypothetical protein ACYDEY_13665 [Acidimicrobiales bacterium]